MDRMKKPIIRTPNPNPKAPPAPNPAFTQALAREIVKNLVAIGQFTARPFNRERDGSVV
jgi:hypothetical protein